MAVPSTPNFDPTSAQAGIDQQKAALLAALAQGGSAMAQQQAQTQQAMQASTASAAQMASQRAAGAPGLGAEQSAAAGGQGAYYAQIAAAQAGAGNTAMGGLQAANSQYMDQASAAVPAIHAQTGRELQSMQHAASQAQADRDLRTQIAQMQLQETQARIAAAGKDDANEGRRLELEDRRLGLTEREIALAEGKGTTKTVAERLAEDEGERKLAANQRGDTLNSMMGSEGQAAGQALSLAVMDGGKPVDSYAAALARLNQMYARQLAKTPGGKDLDRNYMVSLLAKLYGVTPTAGQSQALGGASAPAANKPESSGIVNNLLHRLSGR